MNKTRDLIFIAFYVALACVLDRVDTVIPFLQMPQGGSISLAVIPVFVSSYHLGWKKGVAAGLLWWLVGFILGSNRWFLNPVQYMLDYLIPACICGMASIMPKIGKISNLETGIVSMMTLKYAAHLIAGAYYYPPEGAAQGSLAAWIYSLGYNFWYNFATLLVAVLVVPMLIQRISKHRSDFSGLKKN